MMLSADHAAETREVTLGQVRVHTILAIGFGVVDTPDVKAVCQQIPMSDFVGRKVRTGLHPFPSKGNTLGFTQKGSGQGTAASCGAIEVEQGPNLGQTGVRSFLLDERVASQP